MRTLFASAKAQRKGLEASPDPIATQYQENLQAAIASLEECRQLADRVSLFSSNEFEDDVATEDLQYSHITCTHCWGAMANGAPDTSLLIIISVSSSPETASRVDKACSRKQESHTSNIWP